MNRKNKSKGKTSFFSDPLLLALSLVLSLLPLVMFPFGVDMYALPKVTFLYIATAVLVFIYLIRSFKLGKFVLYRSPLDIPVLLVVIMAIISVLFSDIPLLGLVGKYKRYENLPAMICYAAIYFFTIQTIQDKKAIERMVKIMAVGFAVVAVYGLLQAAGIDFPTVLRFETRVHASLGNPILLGTYLILMLPLLYSLAKSTSDERWRLFAWSSIIIGIINLIYTESRGAWFGLLAAIIAMVVIVKRGGVKVQRHNKASAKTNKNVVIIGILVLIIMLGASFFITPNGHFVQRLSSTVDLSESSVASRIEIWKASFKMVSDRPLHGFGLEQMGYWFPIYKTAKHVALEQTGVTDRTHNDLLQAAVDMGFPGMILYIWMFALPIMALFKDRGLARNEPYSIGLAGAITGYLAQAQTGIPAVFITPIVWSLLGISITTKYPSRKVIVPVPSWLKPGIVTPTAIAILIGLTTLAVWPDTADYHIYKGRQLARTSLDQAAPEFEAAINLYPYQTEYEKSAAEFYLDYGSYDQNPIFARRAALLAEQGLRYNRRDFELAYYDGEASFLEYRLTGKDEALTRAQNSFKYADTLWPSLAAIKNRRLDIATLKGDSKTAKALAEELIRNGQEDPKLYYLLATDAQNNGESKKAEKYFKKIDQIDPNFLLKVRSN